jgi:hypothetical protein
VWDRIEGSAKHVPPLEKRRRQVVRRKLVVGAADDALEVEADRAADAIMRALGAQRGDDAPTEAALSNGGSRIQRATADLAPQGMAPATRIQRAPGDRLSLSIADRLSLPDPSAASQPATGGTRPRRAAMALPTTAAASGAAAPMIGGTRPRRDAMSTPKAAPAQPTTAAPARPGGAAPGRPAAALPPKTAGQLDEGVLATLLAVARSGGASEADLQQSVKELFAERMRISRARSAMDKQQREAGERRSATLKYYGDELQLCLDKFRVAKTKQQAKQIYVEAGRNATSVATPDPAVPLPAGKTPAQVLAELDAVGPAAFVAAGPVEPTQAVAGLGALTPDSKNRFVNGPNVPPAAQAIAKQYGLDEAEILAIITYCYDDYRYINPATAFSPSWLAASVAEGIKEGNAQFGTMKQRLEEGGLHVGMLMSALAKLPPVVAPTFRGERMSQEMFDGTFVKGVSGVKAKVPSMRKQASWSASRVPSKALAFAKKPVDGKPIALLYTIQITNGRDVHEFSPFPEAEVLCPPGSVFRYVGVQEVDPASQGIGTATSCYMVRMTQTWAPVGK